MNQAGLTSRFLEQVRRYAIASILFGQQSENWYDPIFSQLITKGMKTGPLQEIRLQNFRCFQTTQSARLAPLTLLIGDNSTGKTSLLAALRAVWNVAFEPSALDFRATPDDLGGFSDIVHNASKGQDPASFKIGFTRTLENASFEFDVTFDSRGADYPAVISLKAGDVWIEAPGQGGGESTIDFGIANRAWRVHTKQKYRPTRLTPIPSVHWIHQVLLYDHDAETDNLKENQSSPDEGDYARVRQVLELFIIFHAIDKPFASAPTRSSPRRTYDPIKPSPDPEGRYVPTYFANLSGDRDEWKNLKRKLDRFGRESGLFHAIDVKKLGDAEGGPFQLEIQMKNGRGRNLIDVGYGVSQVLPVMAELLRPDGPSLFLSQQPEVHLHPSAQAALGSLFCQTAALGRQLIIETHSDYILDRILLDIRDKQTELKAEDVSILFFQRKGQAVSISSIKTDEEGNILDAPDGYRRFFANELKRVIEF